MSRVLERTPITGSSNVADSGYDPASREAHVGFHSGYAYVVEDVSPEEYADFIAAASKGKFFSERWKNSKTVTRL